MSPSPGFGRAPIGVNQQQGGDDYPFVQPSEDVQKLFADAFFEYADDGQAFMHPLRIAWLYGFGSESAQIPITPVHAAEMQIVDAENRIVFDTRDANTFASEAWGSRFNVYTWTRTSGLLWRQLSVIAYTQWESDEVPVAFPIYFEPQRAVFDERVCRKLAINVRTLQISGQAGFWGPVILQAGNNISLATRQTRVQGRTATELAVAAIPGAGAGPAECRCSDQNLDPLPILRVNGISPAAGNLMLAEGGCYRVLPVIAQEMPPDATSERFIIWRGTLKIENSCKPCGECSDFFAVYEGLRRLRDYAADIHQRLLQVRDRYLANLKKFLQVKRCIESSPLGLRLLPQCPGLLTVTISFCNTTDSPISNLVLVASFRYSGDSYCPGVSAQTDNQVPAPSIVCETGLRSGITEPSASPRRLRTLPEFYNPRGSWPYYWAGFPCLLPHRTAFAVWQLQFPVSEIGYYRDPELQAQLEQARTDAESWQIEVVLDAYAYPAMPPDSGPLPGYNFGSGPTSEGVQYRLVDCPIKESTHLVVGNAYDGRCCDDDPIICLG